MTTRHAPRIAQATLTLLLFAGLSASAQETRITVQADQLVRPVSRYLTGACLEDVNHEIYGGLYSQMIFGESFQEPAPAIPPQGFKALGGTWRVTETGELWARGQDGPKLVSDLPPFADGAAGVEIFLPDPAGGNAGLIVKVNRPGMGADRFDGYEIALDAAQQVVRLGRHRQNWEHIQDTPCAVAVGRWIPLTVQMTGPVVEVLVDGKRVIRYEDREHPLAAGTVGLRPWQREARYRNLWIQSGGRRTALPFQRSPEAAAEISGMWRGVQHGTARGQWALETAQPYLGRQSQRIAFVAGRGEIGLENQGLNRWGMRFVEGRPYEGYLWARAEKPVTCFVALESRDGARVHAEMRLEVSSHAWQRLEFALAPTASEKSGRFVIKLKEPGSLVVGHAFLHPGPWGRFQGLPVRRDVAEALIDQGITVLRYGGSMINHPEYRWKKMIGPRDRRPPYHGTWYPHSSNGWGIPDFIAFCRAAGFLCVPAFHMGETPQDMADFMDYANGPADSPWGAKRAADGQAAPFRLKYLQLGNEERVDESYWQKFKPMAEAIWARDAGVVLVVGDFLYTQPIQDPFNFQGGVSGITSLAAHQKILQLAKAHDREVWFDVHVGTEGPGISSELAALPSYVQALARIADGAKHQVVVFEFNAGNHQQRRALANAQAIHRVERLGLPIATSANCLQPDGQNDNDWDQGLLFLNPSQVWLQPPGYVTRMLSRNYQPRLVQSAVEGATGQIDVNAKRSEDGKTLVVQVVHLGDQPLPAAIALHGFTPSKPTAVLEELAGPLNAVNTADQPHRLTPKRSEWRHELAGGTTRHTFAAHSFTVLRFE